MPNAAPQRLDPGSRSCGTLPVRGQDDGVSETELLGLLLGLVTLLMAVTTVVLVL